MSWKKHHDKMKKTSGSFHKIFLKFFYVFFHFDFFCWNISKETGQIQSSGQKNLLL